MSLKHKTVNPLGILNLRKLSFIPSHFSKITINIFDIKMVEHWIQFNLNSRYAFQPKIMLDNNRKFFTKMEIGLEDPSEITLLMLGCRHITQN